MNQETNSMIAGFQMFQTTSISSLAFLQYQRPIRLFAEVCFIVQMCWFQADLERDVSSSVILSYFLF